MKRTFQQEAAKMETTPQSPPTLSLSPKELQQLCEMVDYVATNYSAFDEVQLGSPQKNYVDLNDFLNNHKHSLAKKNSITLTVAQFSDLASVIGIVSSQHENLFPQSLNVSEEELDIFLDKIRNTRSERRHNNASIIGLKCAP